MTSLYGNYILPAFYQPKDHAGWCHGPSVTDVQGATTSISAWIGGKRHSLMLTAVRNSDYRRYVIYCRHWDTITNLDAIEVNQDYAGHSGTLFAASDRDVTMHGCDWKAGVSCDWPTWTSWYKPLSKRDARKSSMAVLLLNNEYDPAHLTVEWDTIPGFKMQMDQSSSSKTTSCTLYDVWNHKSLGKVSGPSYTTPSAVPPRDSVFLTLSDCN